MDTEQIVTVSFHCQSKLNALCTSGNEYPARNNHAGTNYFSMPSVLKLAKNFKINVFVNTLIHRMQVKPITRLLK